MVWSVLLYGQPIDVSRHGTVSSMQAPSLTNILSVTTSMHCLILSTRHSLHFDITIAAGVSCLSYYFSSQADMQQTNLKLWESSRHIQAKRHLSPALNPRLSGRNRVPPQRQNGHSPHGIVATHSILMCLCQLHQTVLLRMVLLT